MNAVLSTNRLSLREATVDDAAFIFKLVNDDGWLKYIGDRKVRTIEDAKKYIKKSFTASYDSNGFGLYIVNEKSTNINLGVCGLVNRPTLDDVDIGFAFLKEYCGQGYGFESSKAILDFAFSTLKLPKVLGITIEKNIASRKLLEKIGLTFEKKVRFDNDEELLLFSIINK